ncbi:MAG: hypothetical protein AAGA90_16705 [Actinomycetota bacterium]
MRRAHPRKGRLSLDDPALRLAYRRLIESVDPARPWLDAGGIDARFAGDDAPEGSVGRGPADLAELHDIIDDLFGPGCFTRPARVGTEIRRVDLEVARPASVMPFIEALRPHLEGRGPAFWTWKTAREAVAVRLQALDHLTVEAAR